jgi:hypothetical protein
MSRRVLNCWIVAAAIAAFPAGAEDGHTMVRISLKVPDPAWSISVTSVREIDNQLWVLAALARRDVMAAQVISTVTTEVAVNPEGRKLRVFILGKTWAWPNEEAYEFLPSVEALPTQWTTGKVLYPRTTDDPLTEEETGH